MSLWGELKRRNVVRVGAAYVLVAWILLQVADFALDVIDAPNWIMQVLVLLAAIGLPAVLVFAWVFEMTPEGLKLERDVDRSQSITTHTGKKLNMVIIAVLAVAVVVLGVRQYLGAPGSPQPTSPASAARALPNSVAVLPFEDYSEGGDQAYFSKGIAEEILNLLAQTDALRVAARTSSFAFAGSDMDIRDIGHKLDVGTVLEGSVRKAGPTIRITAQLINVEDGYHIWSETYDRDFQDVFKIQDEIAASIIAALRHHLLGESQARPTSERTTDMGAFSAYLIGKERMALRTREDIEAARVQFEKALEIDPDFAPAHVQLAHAWLLLEQERFGGKDMDPKEVDAVVTPHLERALELAPDLPEAIAVTGLHDLRRYRYKEAQLAFDRALELNPNYAIAYTWRAETAYQEERFLDMLADKEKAYALDPMSLEISADLATEYRNFWRPQDAERVINRMFDLHPDHPLAYQAAIGNLANHGRYGEATLMLEKALKAHPDSEMFKRWKGWSYMYLGMYDEAARVGNDEVRFAAAMMSGDQEEAESLLDQGLAGKDPATWYPYGRWLYSVTKGEGSRERLGRFLDLYIANTESKGQPWREQCHPYLINELRMVGRDGETAGMMDKCQKQVEQRFKAHYLCPCSWFEVVQYTILDGRMDEAVQRADQWLSNGDSSFDLHIDPIFAQLSDRPQYADFLARNAAQIQRQREIYLAGTDTGLHLGGYWSN